MNKHITICRGVGPASAGCVDSEEAKDETVLAPCKLETDTCTLNTGDALLKTKKEQTDQQMNCSDDCCCEC